MMGVEYGGEIQYTTLREADKVYWCNVNQKWYIPKFTNIIPAMTANSQHGWIVSHSGSAGGTYPPFNLFDGVDSTAWLSDYVTRGTTPISDASPEYVIIEKSTPFHVNALKLVGLKNGVNNGSPAYSPKKVTIQGFDGAAWKTIVAFSDIKYKAYLVDGDTIPFKNSESFYKYKIIFQSHKYAGKYSIAFSAIQLFSGKGAWTIADTDWEEYDSNKTARVLIDDGSYPMVVNGVIGKNLVHVEIDLCRLLTTDFTSLEETIPSVIGDNLEVSPSGGGYMILAGNGVIKYLQSVQATSVRGWLHVTYPYKKDVRAYV